MKVTETMKAALLGRKIGMTRFLDEDGNAHPATVIQAGPCTVVQVKTPDRDGYHAVQLGFEDQKPHRSTKPLIGHAAKARTGPKRVHREVRCDEAPEVQPGEVVTVQLFADQQVQYVDVAGVTKGRGFSGVMRRYGFGGQPASHGTERKHRSPGGIGGMAPRGRGRAIKKGKRMSGHLGHVNRTVRNQRLVSVDAEHNVLIVRGGVPGPNGGLLYVSQSVLG